jgi:threonine aldolase
MEALMRTNMEQLPGYGSDPYCERAKEKIRKACGTENAEVFFISGGTQTNMTVITSILRSYQGVVAAQTGHISVHEAGAIEAGGHKVITLPHHEGKISAGDLKDLLDRFYGDETYDHMVFPGMVYISHPTEYGTLYTLRELKEISEVCRENHLPLYMDGARLGYGLASLQTDVSLKDVAELCDVFYIGGTKVGALCGEAVVFSGMKAPDHFFTTVKQRGALLAKGRVLGVQFDALFTDDLYMKISRHAILMAEKLKDALREAGIPFFKDSPTNQQFVILENDMMEKLSSKVSFSFWEKYDETHTVVRFATSWATTEEQIDQLRAAFSAFAS